MKHIICSGCSFTRQYKRIGINGTHDDYMKDLFDFWRWPHHIKNEHKDVNVYNFGNPSNDNRLISLSIINKVSQLLKNGVHPSDIFVIVQWSDSNRKSFFISNDVAKTYNSELKTNEETDNSYAHTAVFLDNMNENIGKNGYFILSGGYSYSHVVYPVVDIYDKIAKYHSFENSTIEFFEIILNLQNFLNLNSIDFFQFNLSYNFTQPKLKDLTFSDIYFDKKITNSFFEFNYDNPYIQFLYELIEMDKFYLYSNSESTNNGGILEWAIENFDVNKDKRLFMEHNLQKTGGIENFIKEMESNGEDWIYGHVSSEMNRKFLHQIINPKLNNFLNNK